MPYCSGCGSRYQVGDLVCKSCGFELQNDLDPKTAGRPQTKGGRREPGFVSESKTAKSHRKKTVAPLSGKEPSLTQPEWGSDKLVSSPEINAKSGSKRKLQSESMNAYSSDADIHLGKGIIKPKSIEQGMDGFHFKYEGPPMDRKAEPFVPKMKEAEIYPFPREGQGPVEAVSQCCLTEIMPDTTDEFSVISSGTGDAGTEESLRMAQSTVAVEIQPEICEPILAEAGEARPVISDILETVRGDIKLTTPETGDVVSKTQGECISPIIEQGEKQAGSVEESTNSICVEVQKPDITPVWKGHSSWYGIPFPSYYILMKDLLRVVEPNGHMNDFKRNTFKRITLRQSWIARLLGIGDLIVEMDDELMPQLILSGIVNPGKVKALMERI